MPLVFCELALAYPPAKVSDPSRDCRGQWAVSAGGARGLSQAGRARQRGRQGAGRCGAGVPGQAAQVGLRFRYAEDAVATRMYRTTAAMMEGWTKNLALLFNNALALALWRALDFVLLFGLPVLALELWNARLGGAFAGVAGARAGFWRCCGCGRWCGFMRGWRSRTFRLLDCAIVAAGVAAVCGAALPELVSASDSEARKLEGAGRMRDSRDQAV